MNVDGTSTGKAILNTHDGTTTKDDKKFAVAYINEQNKRQQKQKQGYVITTDNNQLRTISSRKVNSRDAIDQLFYTLGMIAQLLSYVVVVGGLSFIFVMMLKMRKNGRQYSQFDDENRPAHLELREGEIRARKAALSNIKEDPIAEDVAYESTTGKSGENIPNYL